MNRFSSIFLILVVCASCFLPVSHPLAGTVRRYIEDFSTQQYNDASSTTARWYDGSLGLHPFVPTLVAGIDTLGFSRDLFVDGNHVFLAGGLLGLQVIDILDPANPKHVGQYDTPGFSSDVYVSGDHVFVADGLSGLLSIDISSPSQPKLAGAYITPGFSRGVTVEGKYAYIADGELEGDARLLVVNVSDPTQPNLAGSMSVAGLAIGSFVAGDFLYFAGGPGGLHIIEITDPRNPVLRATYPTSTYARNVVVAEGRAYLANAESGLLVIDVTDPANPTLLASYDTPNYAFGLAVSGNQVRVADDENGVQAFDINTLGVPTLRSTTDTPAKAIGIVTKGGYTYVADGLSGLQIIRTGELAALNTGVGGIGYGTVSIVSDGSMAYLLDQAGFSLVDATTAQVVDTRAVVVGDDGDIDVAGPNAFVVTGDSTLLVFDVSDQTNPAPPASFRTGGEAIGVAVRGDHAFVAEGATGLEVVDISNPSNMSRAALLALPGLPRRVVLHGPHALVASEGYGLVVVDVSDPSMPAQVGEHADGIDANDIAIDGNHAFVSTGNGLRVFDITDPVKPTPITNIATPGDATSVAVSGDIAVVGDRLIAPPAAIHAFDIADPSAPVLIGTIGASNVRDVCILGNYACVADDDLGMRLVEIFHDIFDRSRNVAQSLDVHGATSEILRARLTTQQVDSINWQLTSNATPWQDVVHDGSWQHLESPGNELRWRSTHHYVGQSEPLVLGLELEWLYHHPSIDSIVDVPGDEGGWVNLHFARSGHDFIDDSTPITQYVVYRRSNDPPPAQAAQAAGPLGSALPPGSWDVVAQFAAGAEDQYIATVETHGDSADGTAPSVYAVAAETPAAPVFCSPPDSGYSVDNRIVIAVFDAARESSAIKLTWSVGGSISGFNIYRSLEQSTGFEKINSALLSAAENTFVDETVDRGKTYWYQLGVIDPDGNETLSGLVSEKVPIASFALYQNHPNPFNPTTTITYEIPASGHVSLQIFDVGGRLVRSLINQSQIAGRQAIDWDGTDSQNRSVASGIYFYRLRAVGLEQTRKMTLLE